MGVKESGSITFYIRASNLPTETYVLAEAVHRVKEQQGLGNAKDFVMTAFPTAVPNNYFKNVKTRSTYIDSSPDDSEN